MTASLRIIQVDKTADASQVKVNFEIFDGETIFEVAEHFFPADTEKTVIIAELQSTLVEYVETANSKDPVEELAENLVGTVIDLPENTKPQGEPETQPEVVQPTQ